MADQVKVPRGISREQFLDQIRAGVFDAMHQLMTSGNGSPSDNFYGAIKDGVREALRATVTAAQLRSVISNSAPEPNAPATEGETKL